jgi:Tol biopolymer transport system component/DNA-binding winged helix-turn-helix (wHTH) protein
VLYEIGACSLDTQKRLLTRDGEPIALAPKTFDLLLALVESGGRVLSKAELMHSLWPDTFVEEANLSFQISTLRKALGENGPKWIETVPKHGYRFIGDVQRVDRAADVPLVPPRPRTVLKPWTGLWRFGAIGVGAILVAILAVWMVRRVSRVPNDLATVSPPRPLTAWPGYQQNPSLSPDGNQVAFSWDGAGSENYDIYVKLVGPGEPIRLTTDPAVDDHPVWSPDGRSIAFLRFRSESQADIFVIPALGGAERKVAVARMLRRGTAFLGTRNLAWTPDGKWLAFGGSVSDNEAPGIWLVSATGGEQRRLTTLSPPDLCEWAPAFTADGRYLAFIRERTLSTALVFVLPLSQLAPLGPPQRVSPEPANVLSIAWKPDGSGLLVSSAGHFGLSRTYSVPFRPGRPLAASDLKPLPFGERARGITIAGNGRVVYAAQFRDANIWRIGLGSQGQPSTPIAASTLDELTPDYSPDGNRLVFASTRSGVEELWLAHADGSNPKQITFTGGAQCSNPRWSRDGRLILFNSRREGSSDLYLLDPETSELRRLTNHPAEEVEPNWSRDGRTIYFTSNRTGRDEIWRMPGVGGEAVQVTSRGGEAAIESPDGRYLYYAKNNTSPSTIWRVPVSGGEEERVVDGLSHPLNFVVGARGVYFLAVGNRRNQTSLDSYDYATGKRSKLVSVGKPFWWGMALSPDETSLLYSVVDNAGSNLMLVDNFR